MRKYIARTIVLLLCLSVGLVFAYSKGYLTSAANSTVEFFKHKPTGKFSPDVIAADFEFLQDRKNAEKFSRWDKGNESLVAWTKSVDFADENREVFYSYNLSKSSGVWELSVGIVNRSKTLNNSERFGARDANLDGEVDLWIRQTAQDAVQFQLTYDTALEYLHQLEQQN